MYNVHVSFPVKSGCYELMQCNPSLTNVSGLQLRPVTRGFMHKLTFWNWDDVLASLLYTRSESSPWIRIDIYILFQIDIIVLAGD